VLATKTLLEKTNSQEDDSMRQKSIAVLVLLVAIVAAGLAGLAPDTPTEAPAGFDTPTLVQNPGSHSHSNGIAQPVGDTYDIETGDGIGQAGLQDTANELRTAPPSGLRMRPRFIHDLKSLSLRHRAAASREIVARRKQQLFSFLNSV